MLINFFKIYQTFTTFHELTRLMIINCKYLSNLSNWMKTITNQEAKSIYAIMKINSNKRLSLED
jgi:hypothetical protein